MKRADNRKVLLLIVGFFLLLIAVFYAIWISDQFYKKTFEATQQNLMNKAENIQVFIEANINDRIQNLGVIAKTAEIVDFAHKRAPHQQNDGYCPLKSIQDVNSNDFVVIALTDTNGIPFHAHYDGTNFADSILSVVAKTEIKEVLKTKQPIIGKSYEGPDGSRFINMVFPVFSEEHIVGTIFVAYNITAFCKKYFSDLNHQAFPIEISDTEGNFLFNSQPGIPDLANDFKNRNWKPQGISANDLLENERWAASFTKHQENTAIVTFQDTNNMLDQVVLAATPLNLGNHPYLISVYDDLENATSTTYLYTRNVFIVLGSLLLLFLLFWIFGWSYLKRFVQIKKETFLLSKISQSENRYWELFDASPMPIVVLSAEGTVSVSNKEFLSYFGLKEPKNAFGKNIVELIRMEDKDQFISLINRVERNKFKNGTECMTISFYHPNGQLKTGEFTATRFTFDKKHNILCIINDLTEKKLAENLSLRFGRILNNSHNEIFVIDAQTHKFLHATDGALNHLGYTIDELRQLSPKDITDQDDAGFKQLIKPLINQTTEQLIFEIVHHQKDGGSYPAEVTLQMSHEENPPIFIAILRDLSLEKKAAETIAKERSRAQEYLELAEVMFVVLDTEGNITMINRRGCKILEYEQEELIGKPWIDVCVPQESRTVIAESIAQSLSNKDGGVKNFESQIVTKSKQHKLISWQHKPIISPEGIVTGLLSSGLDISEAKKQEYDLKVSQRQYATLISNLNGIVYRCLNDGFWTMQFISDGVQKMTGYTPDELLLNAHIAFSDIIYPEDRQRVAKSIRTAVEQNKTFQLEYRITKKTGEIIWVTENGQAIVEGDQIQHLEGLITDITKIKEAEIQLLKLSTAIQQSASSIVITDIKGVIEYVNPYFSEITGYNEKEAIGKKVSIMKSGLMSDEHYSQLWETITTGQTWYGEFQNRKKSGELFWESAVIAPVKNTEGIISSYIAIKQDITELKQNQTDLINSQKELKVSEALFKALSGASFEAIFMSKHGKCIGQNKTAELMFGYSEEEAIGQPEHHWFKDEEKELVNQRLSGGNEEPFEATALRKNGTTFPCEIKTRVAEYQGNMVLFTAITNISRRKEAQKNLLESEARYRALIQNNTSVMLLFDPENGEIVEANKAASNFYGMSEEELKKTCIFDINTMNRDEISEKLNDLRSGKKSYFVFKHYTANGEIKDVELYTGRMDYQGRELYFSVIHDITEKLQNQKELILSREKAVESDRLKSAFLANMSHEIRTPMNAIIGFSQLLNDEDITPEESESYINIINKSGSQLLDLIDDIIKISQIEAGIISIQPEDNKLTELLNETYNLFSLTVKQKGIALNLDVPEQQIPSLYTDASRFKQVMINLLSNAIKFTHQGEVRFGYTVEGEFLQFFVKDTGIGIDPQHFQLIFDRFMQVPQNSTKLYGGTGIGLSISQALVEKMGGKIWLESEVGQGTTFYFTLPNIQHGREKPEIVKNKPDGLLTNKLTGKKVLIVEDEPSNQQLLKLFLQPTHAVLLMCENGLEALEIINHQDIDIVLMDIKMPVMNGLEATMKIKKIKPEIPIIIQTAYAMANEREDAFKAGCDAYLAKPVKKVQLIDTMIQLLV